MFGKSQCLLVTCSNKLIRASLIQTGLAWPHDNRDAATESRSTTSQVDLQHAVTVDQFCCHVVQAGRPFLPNAIQASKARSAARESFESLNGFEDRAFQDRLPITISLPTYVYRCESAVELEIISCPFPAG